MQTIFDHTSETRPCSSGRAMEDLLLGDVEDSIADVVRRRLPVSVDEAAAPAVLTH